VVPPPDGAPPPGEAGVKVEAGATGAEFEGAPLDGEGEGEGEDEDEDWERAVVLGAAAR
jgi:hypothetical protein